MEDLIEAALAVRKNAYAPYSKFLVGAAIKTASGAVFVGCNVENAAYPEGTCAEAGAVAAMIAAGEREIVEVAVIGSGETAVSPCGGCRQKLAEFAASEALVLLASPGGAQTRTTVGELLPGAFSGDALTLS